MSVDGVITAVDGALRSLAGVGEGGAAFPEAPLDDPGGTGDRSSVVEMMRVNHSGEVCAQALYLAQSIFARRESVRDFMRNSARDEARHLLWTRQRLEALGGKASRLNPAWFAGAFGIGAAAAIAGDRFSLGFLAETERQVERHFDAHLRRVPPGDPVSRAVLRRMRADEAAHAADAEERGGGELTFPAQFAMRLAAVVMKVGAAKV